MNAGQEERPLQQQEDPQPPHIKEEEEDLWEEFLPGQEEADLSKFPLTVVSVKTEEHEDKPPESSQLHHSPNVCEEHLHPEQQKWSFRMRTEEPQPSHIKKEEEYPLIPHFKEEEENPLNPLSKDEAVSPLKTNFKEEEEDPLTPHFKEKAVNPLSPHIKEEEEEHSISQQGENLEGLEEVDVTKMPVTGVPVTSEDDDEHLPEQQKWSFRMATEVPHPSHIKEEDAALQTLHIKKEEEEHSTVTGVPVTSEEDDEHLPEQQKWSFRMATEVPHPSHIKEEDAALQTLHIKKEEEEHSTVTGVPVTREEDDEHLPEQQKWSFRMATKEPHPSHIKEEDAALQTLRIKKEEEEHSTVTGVPVTSEDDDEHLPEQQKWSFRMATEVPHPSHIKEEDAALQTLHIKKEEEEHSTVTGVPVTSEDDDEHLPEQQKWSFRMATEVPHPSHIKEEDAALQTLHIKKEEEEHSTVTGVPVTSEDDDEHLPEQQKWSFRMATKEPHPSHIKEEDAALQTLRIKKEEEEHSTVTGVPVTSEDDDEHLPEQQKWSFRMATEVPHPSHIKEEDAALQTLHIKKEEEEHSTVTGVPVTSEGDGVKSESEGKREAGDEDSKDDKARFKCSHCDKTFRFRCALTTHVRKHTGERPFVCSVCSGRFSTKSNLEKHKTVHTGEKPFICSVCFKGFRLRQDWKAHMRTHTGEKAFSCSVCGERFSSKYQWKKHKCAGENCGSQGGTGTQTCQPTQGCWFVTGFHHPSPSVQTLYATAGPPGALGVGGQLLLLPVKQKAPVHEEDLMFLICSTASVLE
ncbi:zinc finger protein 180-like isoform X2 [Nerophis ophidion]|uniref:zinc finger protein 180-like isoform X2 n=1 Tax=Nerophis ophidion TaxID=159077 RepID=UPI002AE05EE7|nr:zinc finger protein 180-like isoform X2 [Nerophis ophidion]